MTHPTSTEIAGRIEDLYGAPLAALEAHAQDQSPGMLTALLGLHSTLALAEHSITVHRKRLAQLIHPERDISAHEMVHVLDCARRLAEALAVRDTQAVTASAVLQSLVRIKPPEPAEPPRADRAGGTARAVPGPTHHHGAPGPARRDHDQRTQPLTRTRIRHDHRSSFLGPHRSASRHRRRRRPGHRGREPARVSPAV
ncbi:hypothetical protein QWJ26_38870 [Streptomyces sp. CSDS2]|uniref:hypothetical protein n=1 Tax=Streptomyces sp. CSDS2 TaxID=3055051 RepID=UPI0025B23B94|nr:hypothetical protein [Streptomyces sp. CSDS2]MDN3265665.1 hypothetical protein [Streptomyces sp. CSDS2]